MEQMFVIDCNDSRRPDLMVDMAVYLHKDGDVFCVCVEDYFNMCQLQDLINADCACCICRDTKSKEDALKRICTVEGAVKV